MRITGGFIIGLLWLTLCFAPCVGADPIIGAHGAAQFQTEIAAGAIRGFGNPLVAEDQAAAAQAFPTQTVSNTAVSANAGTNSLISSTGSGAAVGMLQAGAYAYDYRVHGPDPDVRGTYLNLDVTVPLATQVDAATGEFKTRGIDAITVTAVATNGSTPDDGARYVKVWRFNYTVLHTGRQQIFLPLDSNQGGGGATSFYQDAKFDPQHVIVFQVGFSGVLSDQFPLTPNGKQALWIGTQTFAVNYPLTVCGYAAFDGVSDLSQAKFLPMLQMTFRLPAATTTPLLPTLPSQPVQIIPIPGSPYGKFYVESVLPGSYDMAYQASSSLQTVVGNVTTIVHNRNSSVVMLPTADAPTLRGGDATGDNNVDFGDFIQVLNAFDSSSSDPAGGYDMRADFNFDGRVDFDDFLILLNSFGLRGDP